VKTKNASEEVIGRKPKHPKPFTKGNATVRIYRYSNKGYDEFKVADWSSGKRVFHTCATLKDAETKAEEIADRLNGGDVDVLELRSSDRAAYLRAVQLLKPSGVPLESAASDFAEACRILGSNSVLEAVKFYAKRHLIGAEKKTPRQIVDEILERFREDGKSKADIRDLHTRLGRFAEDFQMPLADITGKQIDDWLRSLTHKEQKLSKRSRWNYGSAIKRLVNFAKSQKYLPKDWDEMDAVDLPKNRRGKIRLFSPMQMQWYLSIAPEEAITYLSIGAFAGLRTAEIERLDWSDIDLANGRIHVCESIVNGNGHDEGEEYNKTGERYVPIQPNLKAWLKPRAQKSGRVLGYKNITNIPAKLGKKIHPDTKQPIPWLPNAMRHSFITYRYQIVKNIDTVADEAGHDYKTCKRYKEVKLPDGTVVTKELAKQWFAICP
jgi:integrase